ncbi:MAG: L-threonylcarbamoyladenylate synthase [Dehalococcoidales bacterium]|nr:L-threonylcarbamoyladenylate synthase [Dehalococcoidales bacterium]
MTGLSLNIRQQTDQGIAILKQGGIVAYPTDTVYGLGASAAIPRAVERIYEVKERPRNMPLPLLLADLTQISEVADPVLPAAWLLIRRFLPGALTIVLPRSSSVPDNITAGGNTIAIRIPAHPVPIALIKGLGAPIVGTSANLSGKPSPLTAAEVRSQLGDKVDLIIDGGPCPGGKESTIVDMTGKIPVILREGAVPREKLEQLYDKILLKKGN